MARATSRPHLPTEELPTVTAAQMREIDRLASETYGIPTLLLMENAGRGVAELAEERFLARTPATTGGTVVVLAGKGNNGGDGFVVARHLASRGRAVAVWLVAPAGSIDPASDPGVNLGILRKMRVEITEIDPGATDRFFESLGGALAGAPVVVDALLGTGLSGPVRSPYREAIELVNSSDRPVLAVDVPSGLDSDLGAPLGAAVRATLTATLGLPKAGLALGRGPEFAGQVVVVDISIPRQLLSGEFPK